MRRGHGVAIELGSRRLERPGRMVDVGVPDPMAGGDGVGAVALGGEVRHHDPATNATPAATTAAPAARRGPTGSRSVTAASAVAITMLVSRSAATGAAGARVRAPRV